MKMRAAVFEGPERISVREVELTPCGDDDIVMKVYACGLCGSDIRNYKTGLKGNVKSQIMGHEFTGTVTELGSNVTGYKIGDSLAVAPDVSCGECWYCKRGLVNLCANHRMVGTHWPGGFAEYVHLPKVVLARGMVHHIPEGLSLEDAALSEPASSVIAAQENAGVGLGDTVLIIGDGPIGCLHIDVARARGASRVIMAGLMRLKEAERFKPDLLIDAGSQDTVAEVLAFTDGLGVDVAIVANPVATTQAQAVKSVRKRGRVVLFGGLPKSAPETSLDGNLIHYGEIQVMGAFSYPAHIHQKALAIIKAGLIRPSMYFNMTTPLDDIASGFAAAATGKALKVLVKP
jgi:L-iditol 2-dehydrogenase